MFAHRSDKEMVVRSSELNVKIRNQSIAEKKKFLTEVVIFKILPGFEAAAAALLWTLVRLLVTFVAFHVGQALAFASKFSEAIPTLCVVADIQHAQGRVTP